MSNSPLVSIICLCHNQARFVSETIESVVNQTYSNIELIVIDDASADNSVELIAGLVQKYPRIKFLPLRENVGNCKAFNMGYKMSRGAFVLDLAADDVLVSDRIQKQIGFFQQLGPEFGVVFTDAIYIDEDGKFLRNHFEYLFKKRLLNSIPTGDVYKDIISRYFISTPTMLSRREVFDVLNGYDESLNYEDFDFCIRASRVYKFALLDEKLTKVRKVANSMSSGQYKRNDKQLESTYRVCRKIFSLNRNESEKNVLRERVKYELRQAVLTENLDEAKMFYGLLKELGNVASADRFWMTLGKLRLPLLGARNFYQRMRYGA